MGLHVDHSFLNGSNRYTVSTSSICCRFKLPLVFEIGSLGSGKLDAAEYDDEVELELHWAVLLFVKCPPITYKMLFKMQVEYPFRRCLTFSESEPDDEEGDDEDDKLELISFAFPCK